MPDASVDSIVTDPPYEIGFMGKSWDNAGIAYSVELWAEALRVLRPGGHLLAFGATRTYHRMAVAIEDAGFEIRDSIHWIYGSGFPKSLDVSKAIDKIDAAAMRSERAQVFQAWLRQHITPQEINDLTQTNMGHHLTTHPTQPSVATAEMFDLLRPHLPEVPAEIEAMVRQRTIESENFKKREVIGRLDNVPEKRPGFASDRFGGGGSHSIDITAPATPEAQRWQGWGTALKPAHEPIVVARKPLIGTVAANVLEHGTGAINVDGCRIEGDVPSVPQPKFGVSDGVYEFGAGEGRNGEMSQASGRWPANIIFDEDAAAELDAMSGTRGASGKASGPTLTGKSTSNSRGQFNGVEDSPFYGDTGGASRFFYCAKASKAERNGGLDGLPVQAAGSQNMRTDSHSAANGMETAPAANHHPTVKPIALMRWLIRLVTPPGGTVLDPFLGSGTTAVAAILEGFDWIGCEMTKDYWPIIEGRTAWALAEAGAPTLITRRANPARTDESQSTLFPDEAA